MARRNVDKGMRCEVLPPFASLRHLPGFVNPHKDYIASYVGEVVEILDRKVDTVFFRGLDGYTQSADESRFQPVASWEPLGPKDDDDDDEDFDASAKFSNRRLFPGMNGLPLDTAGDAE